MRSVLILLFLITASHAGSFKLYSDTLALDVGTYRYINFRITPDQAENAGVSGSFFTLPENTPVELILLTEYNYLGGWQNRGEIDTLAYFSGTPDSLYLPIPDFGDFVLVVSNRGNFTPIQFAGDFRIVYDGSGITYDSLPMGMTVLVTLLAAGLVIAAILLTVKKLT